MPKPGWAGAVIEELRLVSHTGLGAFNLTVATAGHLPSPNCDGPSGPILTKSPQQLAESPVGHFIEGPDPVFSYFSSLT